MTLKQWWQELPQAARLIYKVGGLIALGSLIALYGAIAFDIGQRLHESVTTWAATPNLLKVLVAVPAAAIGEEVIFRYLPIVGIRKLTKSPIVLCAVILAASLLFGWAHDAAFNIFIQGVPGIVYSVIFLYYGGLQGKYRNALIASSTAHSFTNFFALLPAFV